MIRLTPYTTIPLHHLSMHLMLRNCCFYCLYCRLFLSLRLSRRFRLCFFLCRRPVFSVRKVLPCPALYSFPYPVFEDLRHLKAFFSDFVRFAVVVAAYPIVVVFEAVAASAAAVFEAAASPVALGFVYLYPP